MVAGKMQSQESEVAGHVTSTVKSEEQPTLRSVQVPSPYIFQSGNGATVVGVSSHLSERNQDSRSQACSQVALPGGHRLTDGH